VRRTSLNSPITRNNGSAQFHQYGTAASRSCHEERRTKGVLSRFDQFPRVRITQLQWGRGSRDRTAFVDHFEKTHFGGPKDVAPSKSIRMKSRAIRPHFLAFFETLHQSIIA
jgi:hypothetical protein